MGNILTIKANMQAGNQFTDAIFDVAAVEDGDILKFDGLTLGGHFRFPSSFQNRNAVALKRIILSLGDASDWTIVMRVRNAGDVYEDIPLYQRSDFDSNRVTISGDVLVNLFLMQADYILLTTEGASVAMYAEMTIEGVDQ